MSIWKGLAQIAWIETDRLQLRPLTMADAECFFHLLSDREHLSIVLPYQMSRTESDELLVQTFLRHPLGHWCLVDKETQLVIGVIRLERIIEKQASAEIGYFIAKEVTGQGLMTEALSNVCYLATDICGFRELFVITHKENQASQRVAQKAGFRCIQQYKGSDRYNHVTRMYAKYRYTKELK